MPAEILDGSGHGATSTSYTHNGSLGGITGISNVAAPVQTAKAGYLGQLTEVVGLQVSAASLSVEETASHQLSAAQLLDDDSRHELDVSAVSWSVMGPLTGVSRSGLATADVVYEDSAATVQGEHAGATGSFELTVLDSIADNFGSYAGDGLADGWQNAYFSTSPAHAGPGLDPDGDGQSNAFEYCAGLVPTDASSRFTVQIGGDSEGSPQVRFDPVVSGRTYTVKYKDQLDAATWTRLSGASSADSGCVRTITDGSAAAATARFYIVEIDL